MVKKENMSLEFIGNNASGVTGSMTLIRLKDLNILIEAGLYMSKDTLEEYRINKRNLNIDIKSIDYILIGHVHSDHTMLIPRLFAEGCRAKIIAPEGSKGFLKLMGKDSAYIIDRESKRLENKYKKGFHRIYKEEDVDLMLEYVEEYPMNEKIELTDRLDIRFIPSGHIINAAQIEIWVKNTKKTKTVKILYTSDLGNVQVPNYYAPKFQKVEKANIVIGETTYNRYGKEAKAKTRKKDIEKIKTIIENNRGIVEIPIFALDRCHNVLTILYNLFGYDRDFKQDIVVDSPLTIKMLYQYLEVLQGEEYLKLKEVLEWKNLILIEKGKDSKAYMDKAKNCVVLTASGMLGAGRSKIWLKRIVSGRDNTLIFVGYATEHTLAAKLKSKQDTIKIDNKTYPSRCKVVDLKSFTSHMQYSDLLQYYSTIEADKICLVHGEFKGKCEFGDMLKRTIDKKCGRARVVITNKGTKINL